MSCTVWFSCLRVPPFPHIISSGVSWGIFPGLTFFVAYSSMSDYLTSGFSLALKKCSLNALCQFNAHCDICLGPCWKAVGVWNEKDPLLIFFFSFKWRRRAICLNISYCSVATFSIHHDILHSFISQEVLWL